MVIHRLVIVLTITALIGLSGCMVKFKASEVEYEGHVKSTSYKLDGLAFYNPLKSDTQTEKYTLKGN